MPDWSEHTSQLTGRAPQPEGRFPRKKMSAGRLFRGVLDGMGGLVRWVILTILLSAGLTAILNPSIRDMIWQALLAGR